MALLSKLRWLRITPGRLVALLVIVEGLLWLSNRLEWPHWHKGYAVLVAVAGVAVVLFAMLLWFVVALVFRWRFQFTIRTMLVLTVAVALPFSWLGVEMKKVREQAAVTAWTEREGGAWVYDWRGGDPGPSGMPRKSPELLRILLGEEFFAEIVCLYLLNMPEVTDDDLPRLRVLTKLQELTLNGTLVTDAGLEHLAELTQLQLLSLDSTSVTDAGLEHLAELTRLQWLSLSGTKVSDAGLEQVGRLTQLRRLQLGGTKVTDGGLKHLVGLRQLQYLGLYNTKVTETGVKKLRQALPNCVIDTQF